MLTPEQIETSANAACLNRLVAHVLREAAAEVGFAARWFPAPGARIHLTAYVRNILEVAADLETISPHGAAFTQAARRSAAFLP